MSGPMGAYQAVTYLGSCMATRPTYGRIDYRHSPGHFYIRARLEKGAMVISVRHQADAKFECPRKQTEDELARFISDRKVYKASKEEATTVAEVSA